MNRTKAAIIALISSFFTTILPYVHNKSTYIALRAPYVQASFKRHGALITVKTATPENILLQAYLYDPLSGSKELRGSIYLNSSAIRKPFLYDSASFNPLSKAEYRIYAYIIDPDTKKIVSPVDTIAHIIAVRDIPSARLPASVSYTPFLLKRTLSTQEKTYLKYTALITGIVLFVAGAGLALHYHLKKKQSQSTQHSSPPATPPSNLKSLVIDENPDAVTGTDKAMLAKLISEYIRLNESFEAVKGIDLGTPAGLQKHTEISNQYSDQYKPLDMYPSADNFIYHSRLALLSRKLRKKPSLFDQLSNKEKKFIGDNPYFLQNVEANIQRYYSPAAKQVFSFQFTSNPPETQKVDALNRQKKILDSLYHSNYNDTQEYHDLLKVFNEGFEDMFPETFKENRKEAEKRPLSKQSLIY